MNKGYRELMLSESELFRNSGEQGEIRILTDQKEILQVERQLQREIGIVYEDEYIRLVRDAVVFPDMSKGTYIRILSCRPESAAAVLPVSGGKILLLRHFRHSLRKWVWEIPRGFGEPSLTAEENAEKELERSIRNEDLLRLMNLQKSLVYFNTSIRGNEVMIGKLQNIFNEKDYQNTELTEDVLIELKQAHNQVNIYSDILTGTMDAFASIISNNVNTIMKRMTSLSIVLMVPTLIASFYGMNVDIHIEGLPHAFALIVCFSIFLSATAFVIFRKIKWF